jgi:hypothetical protein
MAFAVWAFTRNGKVFIPLEINQQSKGEGTAPVNF